jgi:hypothetical protein
MQIINVCPQPEGEAAVFARLNTRGACVPIILTSRADTLIARLASWVVAAPVAKAGLNRQRQSDRR